MSKVVGVSGNISNPSRTLSLVEQIVKRASQKFHAQGVVIDIAKLVPDLGQTVSFNDFPDSLKQAHEKLNQAELIVIATPVYKASYSGMLKHFFDLLDLKQLTGKIAILVATGGGIHLLPMIHVSGLLGKVIGLVVTEQLRGLGVGKSLLKAAELFAKNNGAKRIEIISGNHRPKAHEFYRHLGYCATNQTRFVLDSTTT